MSFDILVKLNTCVYIDGDLRSERKIIFKNYIFKGELLFDLITLAPIFYATIITNPN